MKKKQKIENVWLVKPAAEDYRAAHEYLTLLFPAREAEELVRRLRKAPVIERQAKDLLRASQTHLLDENNPHVSGQLKKIKKGKKMSPVLLVRGKMAKRASRSPSPTGITGSAPAGISTQRALIACCSGGIAPKR